VNVAASKLEKAIRAAEFSDEDVAERVLAAMTPVIAVALDEDGTIARGCSKLGGAPDLPADFEPPEGMVFLAQINLAEVARHDGKKRLPASGMLYLFGAEQEDDLSDPERAAKVFFHAGPARSLRGGDTEGDKLRFGASFLLPDDDEGFDSDDRDTFDELLAASGHVVPDVGSFFGPPIFFSEEMDEIFDAEKDVLVLHLAGSAIGDIFRAGDFQLFARKAAVKKGQLDVYFEGGS
jgi:hypothetical protein